MKLGLVYSTLKVANVKLSAAEEQREYSLKSVSVTHGRRKPELRSRLLSLDSFGLEELCSGRGSKQQAGTHAQRAYVKTYEVLFRTPRCTASTEGQKCSLPHQDDVQKGQPVR